MAYTQRNYPTRKALIEDFTNGKPVAVFQPGPFGPDVKDGTAFLSGPHAPKPHKWYAQVEVKDGLVVAIKGAKTKKRVTNNS